MEQTDGDTRDVRKITATCFKQAFNIYDLLSQGFMVDFLKKFGQNDTTFSRLHWGRTIESIQMPIRVEFKVHTSLYCTLSGEYQTFGVTCSMISRVVWGIFADLLVVGRKYFLSDE